MKCHMHWRIRCQVVHDQQRIKSKNHQIKWNSWFSSKWRKLWWTLMYSLCFHRINYVWRPQNSAPSPKILLNVYFCAQVAKYRRMPSFLCKGISGTGILKIASITWYVIFLLLTLDVGPADVNCIKLMSAGTLIREGVCWCLVYI